MVETMYEGGDSGPFRQICSLPPHARWSGPQVPPPALVVRSPVARGWSLRAPGRGCATKAAMAATGRERERARFVYVNRFGSHQCGGVLWLGGRRAQGPWSRGLGAGRSQEETRAAAGAPGGGELPPGSQPRAPATSSPARASSARSRPRQAAQAGLTQKNLAKKFDFPIPLNETSKIMKKKKKVSVWNGVYKVISKMLEENEKYRHRLKCQQLFSDNLNYTR
ncbi:uncharacterized protein C5orf47 homolog [Hippopotamus amphibius kiboko]|uniref:uncharacterized protein C5orf47 homolog n=1 Tax=Hippopotamus amphibius kiboko TaxID=575201 RepID=UPI002592BBA1|nr:uncharacterized protein C5orf47 homolog [Hippopotamus amphibius kiboko]